VKHAPLYRLGRGIDQAYQHIVKRNESLQFPGKALAEAIAGNRRVFDALAQFPVRRFPGGKYLRWPVLVAAMSWYALRDHL